jgi:hypothetical protein
VRCLFEGGMVRYEGENFLLKFAQKVTKLSCYKELGTKYIIYLDFQDIYPRSSFEETIELYVIKTIRQYCFLFNDIQIEEDDSDFKIKRKLEQKGIKVLWGVKELCHRISEQLDSSPYILVDNFYKLFSHFSSNTSKIGIGEDLTYISHQFWLQFFKSNYKKLIVTNISLSYSGSINLFSNDNSTFHEYFGYNEVEAQSMLKNYNLLKDWVKIPYVDGSKKYSSFDFNLNISCYLHSIKKKEIEKS